MCPCAWMAAATHGATRAHASPTHLVAGWPLLLVIKPVREEWVEGATGRVRAGGRGHKGRAVLLGPSVACACMGGAEDVVQALVVADCTKLRASEPRELGAWDFCKSSAASALRLCAWARVSISALLALRACP